MKSLIYAVSVLVLLSVIAAGAQAGNVLLTSSTLADLTSGGPVGGGDPLVTDMSYGILHAQVFSQAYPGKSGGYVYFYQVDNTGAGSDAAIELFTLSAFAGTGATPAAGWLTGSVPEGFLAGSQVPEDTGFINAYDVLSLYFTQRAGAAITPGETSSVLYAVSTYTPQRIIGNLIGARVGSGEVVGPVVPEPSTLGLIGMGLASLFAVRRRTR
jgi:hypothetical protein